MKEGVGILCADNGHNLNEVLVGVNGAARVERIEAPLMDDNVCAIWEEHASEIDFRGAKVHLPQQPTLLDIPVNDVADFVCVKICSLTSQHARRERL